MKIDLLPWGVIGGVLLVSLLAPLFVGAEGWVVPLVVLPFAVAYLLFDRRTKHREQAGTGR